MILGCIVCLEGMELFVLKLEKIGVKPPNISLKKSIYCLHAHAIVGGLATFRNFPILFEF